MVNPDTPGSSDSSHTPLQDENVNCNVLTPSDMVEEQLDYEEFVENATATKELKESKELSEDGECESGDDNCVIAEVCNAKETEEGEVETDNEQTNADATQTAAAVDKHAEASANNDKNESENKVETEPAIPENETPWERGLRLARERRELTKMKKVQEKDNLKEKQLLINLDNIEEVEPISKPLVDSGKVINHKLLKALQPIVVLPEEPKPNEMIMEYYLSEFDYQHRPRFIPSKLYTLDPWEVEEWKRELDMIKFENEIEKLSTSNKQPKVILEAPISYRPTRRGSGGVSSSASSRSSSSAPSDIDQSRHQKEKTRNFKFQTSQYALSRNKPAADSSSAAKPTVIGSFLSENHHSRRRERDLPPEFKNRVRSSTKSSSRFSSGSRSSSSGGSSSSSSSSSSSRQSGNKKAAYRSKKSTTTVPQTHFKSVKKPALGRGRSESSDDSSHSSDDDSSSSSSSSSSSHSSNSSVASQKGGGKEFINSLSTKPNKPRPGGDTRVVVLSSQKQGLGLEAVGSNKENEMETGEETMIASSTTIATADNELPSANSRPGVKLKLLSRPKPVIVPAPGGSSSRSSKPSIKDRLSKKESKSSILSKQQPSTNTTSSIFSNSKPIFSSSIQRSSEIPAQAKESTMKSNLAATQLEMQQEFLRNYKDKIAIYRSQLSYQQHLSGGHSGTLTHAHPPPIKGPITVMNVTSKKTGPPRSPPTTKNSGGNNNNNTNNNQRGDDRGDHHHQKPAFASGSRNSHYSPNYRGGNFRGSRNNNSNTNNNMDGDRPSMRGDMRDHDRGRNVFDKAGRSSDYDSKPQRFDRSSDNYRSRQDYGNDRMRGIDQQRGDRDHRMRFDGERDRGRHEQQQHRFKDDRPPPSLPMRRERSRDFERNKEIDKFIRDDKQASRDHRFRDGDGSGFQQRPERERVDNKSDKNSNRSTRKRDRTADESVSNSNNNNDEISATTTGGGGTSVKPTPLPAISNVPKEKRREELLKQLKAVEDAIAKKKAKIEK